MIPGQTALTVIRRGARARAALIVRLMTAALLAAYGGESVAAPRPAIEEMLMIEAPSPIAAATIWVPSITLLRVDREGRVPVVGRDLAERMGADEPGVVDQHVDPAEVRGGPFDDRRPGHLARDVTDDRDRPSTRGFDLGDDRRRARVIDVVDHDRGTVPGEPQRDRPSVAGGRTGDHRDLAFECHRGASSSWMP